MGLLMDLKKNSKQLLIGFEKFSDKEKILLIQNVILALSEYKDKQYLIKIKGLEVTINSFIEEMLSGNYLYVREKKGKLFIKELANISLLTNNEQDMYTLATYFGAVNEGFINVEVVNYSDEIDIRKSLPDKFEEIVSKNRILEIIVEPDGDILSIDNCNNKTDLLKISTAICDMVFR